MARLGETARGAAPLLEAAQRAPREVPCRGCGAPIIFVRNHNDKLVPADARPTTVLLPPEVDGGQWAMVKGHVPHHITCPDADKFRNRDKK